MKYRAGLVAMAILSATILPSGARSAEYPSRIVKIIVPFAAGGGTDVIARIFSASIGSRLKQTVIIENRPGAAGLIGASEVAKAKPDGYTLLFTPQGTITIAPHLDRPIPYKPEKDLVPIAMVAEQPIIFAANNKLPVKNLDEFVTFAKTHPGQLNYGSPGLSTELNLTVEILKQKAGINIVHVGYRGGAPAINGLLRNDIQMLPVVPSSIGAFIKSGKVKALATTAVGRVPEFPEVPTTKEQGYPDVNIVPWWGVFAPAGTPQPVLDRLQSAITALQQDQKYREKLANMSVEATAILSKPFRKMLADETERWGVVIKKAGLHLQ